MRVLLSASVLAAMPVFAQDAPLPSQPEPPAETLPPPVVGGDAAPGGTQTSAEEQKLRDWIAGTWRTRVAQPGGEMEIVTSYGADGTYAATATVFLGGRPAPNPTTASGDYEIKAAGNKTITLTHKGVYGAASQLEIVDGGTLYDRAANTTMRRISR
jgi:hypothetical protein